MVSVRLCDVCNQPYEHVALKLFLVPVQGQRGRNHASNYTGYLDVGDHTECIKKATGIGSWQTRKPREEEERGNPSNAMAKGNGTTRSAAKRATTRQEHRRSASAG